ncbi:SOUL family heme-binding protein [Methanobacterium aggregans]|uniref:SOUL family heme-binding protein n=1 Tax=Methanobacterium aggregans TaxID=1615586 RepID=UPI001AE6A358|nr:heme-binding protein [Methanobacterium aggregans]MBP2045378.1 hypothetical protein [Methanobacterium aggregans]
MVESPEFSVESKDGKFEIRNYDPYILAQVDVEGDFDDSIGRGFSILAKYIFGANRKRSKISMTAPVSEEDVSESKGEFEKISMAAPVTQEALVESEKISMTAPVTHEKKGKNIHRISFTIPKGYELETLPEPEDDRIKFKEVKNQHALVLKFSGRVKKDLAQEKMDEMIQYLDKKGIKPKSNFIVAQYNNPLVPGFLRRNEIIVEI